MAYIKFKELTRYFSFSNEIEIDTLPIYVTDYVNEDEKILIAYKTTRDKAIFTNKKVVIFDCNLFKITSKITYVIPYKSISTGAIEFKKTKAKILLTLDSGYQIRWDFVNMGAKEKTNLIKVYSQMMAYVTGDKNE